MKKSMLVLLLIVPFLLPLVANAEETAKEIIKKAWEQATCSYEGNSCVEVMQGVYKTGGVSKPFIMYRTASVVNGDLREASRLEFKGQWGSRYLRYFSSNGLDRRLEQYILGRDEKRVIRYIGRPESALQGTALPPFFFTMAAHNATDYAWVIEKKKGDTTHLRGRTKVRDIPQEVELVIDQKYAPILVKYFSYGEVLYEMHFRNKEIGGRYRPIHITSTAYEQTNEVVVQRWMFVRMEKKIFEKNFLGDHMSIPTHVISKME